MCSHLSQKKVSAYRIDDFLPAERKATQKYKLFHQIIFLQLIYNTAAYKNLKQLFLYN